MATDAPPARCYFTQDICPNPRGPKSRRWSRFCAAAWRGRDRSRRLSWPLRLASSRVRSQARLTALEVEGSILRGRFVAGLNDEQWCDRRLLARIHHYTVPRLRSEIEPVAPRDFLRFLFGWQQVTDDARLEGPDALPAALASLEGFEVPANAWETEILPARIANYEPSWLDAQCLSGQRTWARLLPPRGGNGRPHPDYTGTVNADHLARTSPRSALVIARRFLQWNVGEPSGSNPARPSLDAWRVVFR